jgi:hypothetical protein
VGKSIGVHPGGRGFQPQNLKGKVLSLNRGWKPFPPIIPEISWLRGIATPLISYHKFIRFYDNRYIYLHMLFFL